MHEKKRYTYIYLPTFTFSSLLLSDCLAWGGGLEVEVCLDSDLEFKTSASLQHST